MKNTFVLDESGEPVASGDFVAETLRDAAYQIPSAKNCESTPYVEAVANARAKDMYIIKTLVEWFGGIEKVALKARAKRNWVMRDFATGMGATLSWSTLDFKKSRSRSPVFKKGTP